MPNRQARCGNEPFLKCLCRSYLKGLLRLYFLFLVRAGFVLGYLSPVAFVLDHHPLVSAVLALDHQIPVVLYSLLYSHYHHLAFRPVNH